MLRDVLIQKGLSNRESEVAELVTKGLSNKEVANQLFVTEKTVKFHLTNIYKKMNVKSRAQLIVWCLPHMGFVDNSIQQPVAQTPVGIQANTIPAGQPSTIPAGNATVAQQEPSIPTITPGNANTYGGNNNGNTGGTGSTGSFGV